ncbi:MAG: hypothetical protein OCC46_02895 [Pseudodesulfovibrio sp.]
MTYSLAFVVQERWLSVTARGAVQSVETFSEKAATVVQHIMKSGKKRIFLDDRCLDVALDAHDVTVIAKQLEQKSVPTMGLRLACIPKPGNEEIYRTIETIYQNRSFNFRVFSDEESAFDWLLS